MFVNLNPKKVVINYEGIIKNVFCGKKLKTSEETNILPNDRKIIW